jgi:hypothetical protein
VKIFLEKLQSEEAGESLGLLEGEDSVSKFSQVLQNGSMLPISKSWTDPEGKLQRIIQMGAILIGGKTIPKKEASIGLK